MTEPVINDIGNTIAVLTWRDNGDGTEYARLDDADIIREVSGHATVTCQDKHGKTRKYRMPDVATAFYCLGLSAHKCNGVDGWREFSLMPGWAGSD